MSGTQQVNTLLLDRKNHWEPSVNGFCYIKQNLGASFPYESE